jgi:hypothetical protein
MARGRKNSKSPPSADAEDLNPTPSGDAPTGADDTAQAVSYADDRRAEDEEGEGDPVDSEAVSSDEAQAQEKKATRSENIYDPKYDQDLSRIYTAAEAAFQDKNDQSIAIQRYWKCYNCETTPNQMYRGTSQVYLPIVHDAIEARVQRFVNTLFPESGRYTSVLSNVPNDIHAITGLLDHYVRRANMRSKTRELLRTGEVEGQVSIYVEWLENARYITKKVMKHPEVSPGVFDPNDTFPDIEDEEITDARPDFHLISASDLAVVPPTFSDIEIDAEIVAIKRRYTADGVRKAVADGLFDEEAAEPFLSRMEGDAPTGEPDQRDAKLDAVGIQWTSGVPVLLAYELWAKFDVDDKRRWCKVYMAANNIVLGMYLNPNWNDRCSVISKPVTKVEGSGWGKSRIDAVEQLQYMANDWANMAGDNGMYSLLPIVMTDPEKNPMLATMVMNLAAVWQTSPKDTQILEFPQLWKDALEFVNYCESRVAQAFGLNPAMISTGTGSKKQTQADTSQDQAVAVAAITDEVLTLEDDIFTPLLQRFFELDQQHRDNEMVVKIYGQMGLEAQMEAVPPFAWSDRYEISWRGTQAFRSVQMIQQMTAGMNILRSLSPVLPNGMKIDLSPLIEEFVETLWGPRLGSRVLIDPRSEMTIPQAQENDWMASGISVMVHPGDNDMQHLQELIPWMQSGADVHGLGQLHMQAHQQQMQQKAQQQQMLQMQAMGGLPGAPGGMKQPGIAGTPRPGAQPAPPRGGQQPPGAQHQDQIKDPSRMPRPQRAG